MSTVFSGFPLLTVLILEIDVISFLLYTAAIAALGAAIYFALAVRKRVRQSWAVEAVETAEKAVELAGFAYDAEQNIFHSTQDVWQGEFGYCSLYDEAAAFTGMIIDCEPIEFSFGEKQWLLELWKGQYGLCCGAEVGFYSTDKGEITIPGLFSGMFYDKVEEEDYLQIEYSLWKGTDLLFSCAGRTWWLDGFLLGGFARPQELSMQVSITFSSVQMGEAVAEQLRHIGYTQREYSYAENTLKLEYTSPKSPQPRSRTKILEEFTLERNRLLCDAFNALTGGMEEIESKLIEIQASNKPMYTTLTNALGNQRRSTHFGPWPLKSGVDEG